MLTYDSQSTVHLCVNNLFNQVTILYTVFPPNSLNYAFMSVNLDHLFEFTPFMKKMDLLLNVAH